MNNENNKKEKGYSSIDQLLASLVKSGTIKIEESPDSNLFESALNAVANAQQQRGILQTKLRSVTSFQTYLELLCEHYNTSGKTEAKLAGINEIQFERLLNGTLKPWSLSGHLIIDLIDNLNGSLKIALDFIKQTPVALDEDYFDNLGQLVARSDKSLRRKERKEGLDDAARKMALFAGEKDKAELIKLLMQEIG